MVTKTPKVDSSLGLSEKKKKKRKKVAKEPETQSSLINYDDYFAVASPLRATSPSKNAVPGQAPEIPQVKKKKKKKGHGTLCEELLEPEPRSHARRTEKSPSPKKQALGRSESFTSEKKKKRKSLPLATTHGVGAKSSLDSGQGEEATGVGKKLKKHRKEKVAQDEPVDFSTPDPWLYMEAEDAVFPGLLEKDGEEQTASGKKRKQGTPREHSVKVKKKKKKKKIHQEGDTPLGHSRSMESSPRKGHKKKPVTVEPPEFIPAGDSPKSPVKKKMKTKKKVEQPVVEELPLKRKKKRRKESGGAEDPWEEELDTDLEVVLEKKGNMDETHIDQVRRKALQEEIDRESGKTGASETSKRTATKFGQWDTAGFENEEQKLKFLKLMGGFKNLSPSFSRSPSTTGRPNMALSRKEADALQQDLQQDYDRAMSWKYSRGAGLGFAAPNKVFYIDRNASKSIKLDD